MYLYQPQCRRSRHPPHTSPFVASDPAAVHSWSRRESPPYRHRHPGSLHRHARADRGSTSTRTSTSTVSFCPPDAGEGLPRRCVGSRPVYSKPCVTPEKCPFLRPSVGHSHAFSLSPTLDPTFYSGPAPHPYFLITSAGHFVVFWFPVRDVPSTFLHVHTLLLLPLCYPPCSPLAPYVLLITWSLLHIIAPFASLSFWSQGHPYRYLWTELSLVVTFVG
ncbi:uncharacterized protein B0H18DRAFT_7726 [Fomitopsis serialis]|uniref:uncharacterized protein n=1 Tax=Fomitopsis serialis TaxID=139415 RepID=UPI002007238D|nr:uncharacterized protein B0H18DRAFT_7726 [Neoantrodia serialis]KAH9938233.1 hypothetical protein B0H18DRAFT_7726 [Neoantrodia serialis]